MKTIFRLARQALTSAWLGRTRERSVEELDERVLRDIGLEREANYARERARRGLRLSRYY
jgi:uncharacterized protein YjiS (DUF1127 family)